MSLTYYNTYISVFFGQNFKITLNVSFCVRFSHLKKIWDYMSAFPNSTREKNRKSLLIFAFPTYMIKRFWPECAQAGLWPLCLPFVVVVVQVGTWRRAVWMVFSQTCSSPSRPLRSQPPCSGEGTTSWEDALCLQAWRGSTSSTCLSTQAQTVCCSCSGSVWTLVPKECFELDTTLD